MRQNLRTAGCPYDNAPRERYFNTLKNEELIFASAEMSSLPAVPWNILLIPHTIMYDRILITDIVRYLK
ncbi:hypothetical protein SELSPUOL_02587 [Selenomonas sputigena ATCC 35185]|uniref:Uncharacterized protein n=1 Tax=Selenomonas sputigena (strain ATCC 35185 / DSM 20758 / CCUG 44933 / VPI D19B-28) TaxID=546271 RepID=C9LYM6_SELS3|nr:hypothetical protein SELSPUOL_02587 [Selenomonas sputigena ATCC 35185]